MIFPLHHTTKDFSTGACATMVVCLPDGTCNECLTANDAHSLSKESDVARIPPVTREAVPENEKAAYDAFITSRGNRPNVGPYSLLLHMPEMAQRLEALRTYISGEESQLHKPQELVLIPVAREMDCAFIWYAHAAAARQAGVRGDLVDRIRERQGLTNLHADEHARVQFARELQ